MGLRGPPQRSSVPKVLQIPPGMSSRFRGLQPAAEAPKRTARRGAGSTAPTICANALPSPPPAASSTSAGRRGKCRTPRHRHRPRGRPRNPPDRPAQLQRAPEGTARPDHPRVRSRARPHRRVPGVQAAAAPRNPEALGRVDDLRAADAALPNHKDPRNDQRVNSGKLIAPGPPSEPCSRRRAASARSP